MIAMPTQPYLIDGVRVPGVTTILSRFKESGGLVHWAWKLGMQGIDYREVRDTAADAGTIAHDMMECWVRGRTFDPAKHDANLVAVARPAFSAFLTWAEQSKFTIAESEVPLVSKQYRFGGTRDAILIDGKRAIGDWKTSNNVYPEYLCQLGAYAILDEENGGKIEGGFHLLRFSKQEKPDDPVQFTHYYWSQLDKAKKAFLLMRELYDVMADLKRFAK